MNNKKIKIQIGKKSYEMSLSIPKYIYLAFSGIILLTTTIYWAYYSAKVESLNSDQLAFPHYFDNHGSINDFSIKSAHSFILKWPLFWLIKYFNYSHSSYTISTVLLALITVVALALFMYKFEKRPLVLGTLLLALSSVLLMIPIQSAPGSLLPVNMAMLTTRNIEYIIYIISLYMIFKIRKLTDLRVLISILLLFLLILSDHLFMAISLGGAIISLIYLIFKRKWNEVKSINTWLVIGIVSVAISSLSVWLINYYKLSNISSGNISSYYSFITNFKDLAIGFFFSVTGILTNFGANPAYNVLEIKKYPSELLHSLTRISSINYLIDLLILAFLTYSTFNFIRKRNLYKGKGAEYKTVIALIASSLVSLIVFIITNHYYASDARYLALFLFSGFITASYFIGNKKIKSKNLLIVGSVLLINIIIAVFSFKTDFNKQYAAYNSIIAKDRQIISAYVNHKNDYLVGDYWRVYPIQYMNSKVRIVSYNPCDGDNNEIKPNHKLKKASFSLILTIDKELANTPGCSNEKTKLIFGKPDNSAIISGTYTNPQEYILFYDHTSKRNNGLTVSQLTDTLKPTLFSDFNFNCSKATSVNVVAHEDDDLLFINPQVYNDITTNKCIRTIYMTAGDGGNDQFYWIKRQQGAEAAYAKMLGLNNPTWTTTNVQIAEREYIQIANIKNNPDISLIFIGLPDGNPNGTGFSSTKYESLSKLYSQQISSIDSVDKQSNYSLDQLESLIVALFVKINPAIIRTQANVSFMSRPDHSDHLTTSKITTAAYETYEQNKYQDMAKIPIYYYIGYPVHDMDQNLYGNILDNKINIFLSYAKYDAAVCRSIVSCSKDKTYGLFLNKNYLYSPSN